MSDFKESFNQGLEDLAIKIAMRYRQDPERELRCLGFKSILDPLIETYNRLVKEGQIKKLEDLDEDYKRVLWIKSKQGSDEHFKRIVICRAIYLLDVLTKKDE